MTVEYFGGHAWSWHDAARLDHRVYGPIEDQSGHEAVALAAIMAEPWTVKIDASRIRAQ